MDQDEDCKFYGVKQLVIDHLFDEIYFYIPRVTCLSILGKVMQKMHPRRPQNGDVHDEILVLSCSFGCDFQLPAVNCWGMYSNILS